jgi:hypothetical protein
MKPCAQCPWANNDPICDRPEYKAAALADGLFLCHAETGHPPCRGVVAWRKKSLKNSLTIRSTRRNIQLVGKVTATEANCTIMVGPGCQPRRAIFIGDVEHGRCQIRFPGERLTQTLNRQVVTCDPF